jgi:integrase
VNAHARRSALCGLTSLLLMRHWENRALSAFSLPPAWLYLIIAGTSKGEQDKRRFSLQWPAPTKPWPTEICSLPRSGDRLHMPLMASQRDKQDLALMNKNYTTRRGRGRRLFSSAELPMLMKVSNKRNRVLALLSMHTGMTPDAIRGLRPADLDMEAGIIAIRTL